MIKGNLIFDVLFTEALDKRKIFYLPVSGLSMYPTLKDGDRLKVKPIDYQSAAPGDILAYQRLKNKRILIHRLVRKIENPGHDFMLTIAEAGPPKSYDPPLRPDDCVIARVIAIERRGRTIDLDTRQARIYSKIRAYLLVNFPILIIIHRKFIRAIEEPHLIPARLARTFKRFRFMLL